MNRSEAIEKSKARLFWPVVLILLFMLGAVGIRFNMLYEERILPAQQRMACNAANVTEGVITYNCGYTEAELADFKKTNPLFCDAVYLINCSEVMKR